MLINVEVEWQGLGKGAGWKKVSFTPWPGENIHARDGRVVAWI